jgi:hypothetical protein
LWNKNFAAEQVERDLRRMRTGLVEEKRLREEGLLQQRSRERFEEDES